MAKSEIGSCIEQPQRRIEHEPLGSDVEQVERARRGADPPLARLARRQRGVQAGGRDAVRAERVDLVLHERDQRRDDDGGAVAMQRRDLEAQRLAAAGRHEHESVAARDDVLDDLALMGPELRVAEDLRERRDRCWSCGVALAALGSQTPQSLDRQRPHTLAHGRRCLTGVQDHASVEPRTDRRREGPQTLEVATGR